MEQRKQEAGIKLKPVEYYAVRQISDRKFAVATISVDGLVTVAKSGIATVAEAKKALLDIYKSKQSTVKCEFVHPQTLDEKSVEIYKNQPKELPEVTYRIQLNTDKNAAPDNTHFVQQYIKNDNDTYAIGNVVARGDYDRCNMALGQALEFYNTKEQAAVIKNMLESKSPEPKPDFEIYQIKRGEEYHDLRFEPFERLVTQGVTPDFNNYEKVYEGSNAILNTRSNDINAKLEAVFEKFNIDHPEDFRGHSLSVSDVVIMEDKPFYVDRVGFKPLQEFIPIEVKQERFLGELPQRLSEMAEGDIKDIADDALRLNIAPEIMQEACLMSKNDNAEMLAETYDEAFADKDIPVQEAPETDKSKPIKKPKL